MNMNCLLISFISPSNIFYFLVDKSYTFIIKFIHKYLIHFEWSCLLNLILRLFTDSTKKWSLFLYWSCMLPGLVIKLIILFYYLFIYYLFTILWFKIDHTRELCRIFWAARILNVGVKFIWTTSCLIKKGACSVLQLTWNIIVGNRTF